MCVKFYVNAKTDRKQILNDNKARSGIYFLFLGRENVINGKIYIGQGLDLGDLNKGRLTRYYHNSYLISKNRGNSILNRAIEKYGHDKF